MEIGPFSINEVESVKELLQAKQVAFEMILDEDMKDQQMAEFQSQATQSPRAMAGQLDLRFIFFEIADSDYEKIKSHLEKYGIMEFSDGSYELGEN